MASSKTERTRSSSRLGDTWEELKKVQTPFYLVRDPTLTHCYKNLSVALGGETKFFWKKSGVSPFPWQINKAFLLHPKLSPGFDSAPCVQKGQAFGNFLMDSVMVLVPYWGGYWEREWWSDYHFLPYSVVSHLSSSSFLQILPDSLLKLFLSGIVTGIYTYIYVHTYIIYIHTCSYLCILLPLFRNVSL